MAVDTVPTAELLDSLTDALTSATSAFPTDNDTLLPPADGISLLDVKNDLLLSYLQNLVFLIILRLRKSRGGEELSNLGGDDKLSLDDEVIRKLTELRVYIDRGVRPLEGRLRYQIDKVLKAAEDADRRAAQKTTSKKAKKQKQSNGTGQDHDDNSSEAYTGDSISDGSGDEEGESGESGEEDDEELEETLHRPNAAALARKMREETAKSQSKSTSKRAGTNAGGSSDVYKPPRITPTSMPLPAGARERDRDDDRARRRKSNLLNEYIDEELSSAPRAQPSIGSNNTILDRGRSGLSAREREKERERLAYEEANFIRLPGESKTEKRKARLRGDNNKRDMFGGEDWTGLGGLGDRINQSVRGKGGASVLERREKRRRPTEDGQRGDGMAIGDMFSKRQKVLEDRAERKRRKRG